jgi:hypothetical protein
MADEQLEASPHWPRALLAIVFGLLRVTRTVDL